jgi:putative PIN family toxin of toxin-antitoxin system
LSDHLAGRLRVLLDANLIVSYLLKKESSRDPILTLFEMVFRQEVELVLPDDLLAELRKVTGTKPYLIRHVDPGLLDRFINQIGELAVRLRPISEEVPTVTTDRKDDYLIAAAILSDADVLVSGDKHILAVRDFLERPRIMTPAGFLAEFGSSS